MQQLLPAHGRGTASSEDFEIRQPALPLLAPGSARRQETVADWAGGHEWSPRARPADDTVMDQLDIAVSHGQYVGPERKIATLRAELNLADEQLYKLNGRERTQGARAQANEGALLRQERLLGQQVVGLQTEVAEQRHRAEVAAATARDAALRQAAMLHRTAAAKTAEESARHAMETAALRAELGRVRETQTARAEAQATTERVLQELLSEMSGTRTDLAEARECASMYARAVMAERSRVASESAISLTHERDRMIQLARLEREDERNKMLAKVEAQRVKIVNELSEKRENMDEYEHKKALQDEENRAWQQKKNAAMIETVATYKSQISDLEQALHTQAVEAKEILSMTEDAGKREVEMEMQHAQSEQAWVAERAALQQQLVAMQSEKEQVVANAKIEVQQVVVAASKEERALRDKLSGLRRIALHKRATSLRPSLASEQKLDEVMGLDDPKPALVEMMIGHHRKKADALLAKYWKDAQSSARTLTAEGAGAEAAAAEPEPEPEPEPESY